ncbi:hypothetical protein Gotur_023149, partial [Gossypium turneri]
VWTDLGLRQPRLEGEEYLSIIDEFIEAVLTRWPKVFSLSEFEDFQMKWAFETLKHYRERFCMFNDDVQVSTWPSKLLLLWIGLDSSVT